MLDGKLRQIVNLNEAWNVTATIGSSGNSVAGVVMCVTFAIILLNVLVSGAQVQGITAVRQITSATDDRDVVDDICVWVHPDDGSKSVIIGTNKSGDEQGGLYAYTISGDRFANSAEWISGTNWFATGKRINSVDIRAGFRAGAETWTIVCASNRTDRSIDIFRVIVGEKENFAGLALVGKAPVGTDLAEGTGAPYGLAMFHSKQTDKFFAFISDVRGRVVQYELSYEPGNTALSQVVARRCGNDGAPWEITADESHVEGIVADDDRGVVYIAAEDHGIYRYPTQKGILSPAKRVLIDDTASKHLTSDVEGLTLYYGSHGKGYLIASSQGDSTYAIYDREYSPSQANRYLTSFAIQAGVVDAADRTDGIDVCNADLGGEFREGIFLAHDSQPSSFKLVRWRDVADVIRREMQTATPGPTTPNTSQPLALPTITNLADVEITATTGEKPQSKLWFHDGRWWAVLPNLTGTHLWRLDGQKWTRVLHLSDSTDTHADVKAVGAEAHILLFRGKQSELASVEYVAGNHTYRTRPGRPANAPLTLDDGVETATIDIDASGRMWLASDGETTIQVRWSNPPYLTWNGPLTLAEGVSKDDIAVVTTLADGNVGVLWSDQNRQRFGFRLHRQDAPPQEWLDDEVPASASALAIRGGMADDHLNCATGSDGTLCVAVKTSYDTTGYPQIALLMRRTTGKWDDLYEVDESGTRPIVLIDEDRDVMMVAYTSQANHTVCRTSPLSTVSFGPRQMLMSSPSRDVTSTKQRCNGTAVILASTPTTACGLSLEMATWK